MIRLHVFISGKVQGVFFRFHTMGRARSLGLKGWIRNLPDERVEAVFEGEKNKVEEMIGWCRKGPPSAEVSDLEVIEERPTKEFRSFEVRY